METIDLRPRACDTAPRVQIRGAAHPMAMVWLPGEPEPRLEHRCMTLPGGDVKLTAPSLDPEHIITGWPDHLTVRPSLACGGCPLHGYITDGAWTE